MGNVNSIRYRGYFYDVDSKLYYVVSRYYDPVTHRWINADKILDLRDLKGSNLYAYCLNDPINGVDFCGHCVYRFDGNFGHYDPSCSGFKKIVASYKPSLVPVPKPIYLPAPKNPTQTKTNSTSISKADLPSKGEPNSYGKTPDGSKERWYGPDGRPVKDRHNTDHGNPKHHPDVPHDHDWGVQENGKWGLGKGYPSPKHISIDKEAVATVVTAAAVGYGVYVGAKWLLAGFLAVPTGGTSLAVADLTP